MSGRAKFSGAACQCTVVESGEFVVASRRIFITSNQSFRFQITLSLPLFALLRLHLREDYYDNLSGHDIRRSLNYGTFGNPRNSHPVPIPHPFSLAVSNQFHINNARLFCLFQRKNFINYVSRALSGAWIFVVVIVLLFNSITEPPVLYGLGYFVLWTAIILNLVVSFRTQSLDLLSLDLVPCIPPKHLCYFDYFNSLLVGCSCCTLLLPIPFR